MIRYVLGIDPGVNGAFVALSMKAKLVAVVPFPLISTTKVNTRKGQSGTRIERFYDRKELLGFLKVFKNTLNEMETVAYLEQASSRPGEGSATSFKFGDCYGQLKMALTSLNIPIISVTPQSWCREMHKGVSVHDSAKKRSLEAFQMIFTEFCDRRAKRPADGIVDAGLIAEYGRRRLKLNLDTWKAG